MSDGVEAMGKLFLDAINTAYPGTIKQGDGKSFSRPNGCGFYGSDVTRGFYYANGDGDRFYFETAEEAAADCAMEMGMDEAEAKEVLAKGKAVA